MKYKHESLQKYLDHLSAKLPAPGGGSAAALTAALGVALVSMVVNFTLGKPKYEKHQKELKEILLRAENLKKEFLNLVDLDVAAYKSKNIRSALNVPFMVCRLCYEAIRLCPSLIEKSNRNLISDVVVAAVLLESGFSAAYYNVEINLKYLKDKDFSHKVRKELLQKNRRVKRIRLKTEEKVGAIIRG